MRIYGEKPYTVVVVHGGPGAPGSVGTLAKEISAKYGVIEPFQSKECIEDQLSELEETINEHCKQPVILVGHSWGAWLCYFYASKHPDKVDKLIIIGCGPFETKYISAMNESRQNKLTEEENRKVNNLAKILYDPNCKDMKNVFKELGKIMMKADSYEPITDESGIVDYHPNIFKRVMLEIAEMRKSGELLRMANHITCPVIAIHGEEDSHPYQGVGEPLSKTVKNFKLKRLTKCGHYPWNEVHAKEKFYEILFTEMEAKIED